MTRLTSLSTVALLVMAGHAQADQAMSTHDVPEVLDIVGYPAADGERPTGMYMVIPAGDGEPEDARPAPLLGAARHLFFMNRNGGTFVPSNTNDSRTNRSSVPQQTSQILPWEVNDGSWNTVMECVRSQFADYDVEIVDTDPGDLPHIESVVAGRPQDIQLPPGVGGVSPFRNDCGTIENAIVYTFAEVFGNDLALICDVVAQEVAHAFGLDHELLASDPMTYLPFNGQRSFKDVDAQCGEDVARLCACGQQTQNSVAMLSQRLGRKAPGIDPVVPELRILSPVDGARVPPGFQVSVNATDDVGVARVELYIDGALTATLTQGPYNFFTPANMVEGTYIIETRAYDSENTATTTIAVTIDPNAPPPPGPGGPGANVLTGGCSAGSGTGSGSSAALLLLALGACVLRRRRA